MSNDEHHESQVVEFKPASRPLALTTSDNPTVRCSQHPLTPLQRTALAESALNTLHMLQLGGVISAKAYNAVLHELIGFTSDIGA